MKTITRKRRLVAALLYVMGERDAAKGIKPQRTTKAYLTGYSHQYAIEAMAAYESERAEAF